MTSLILIAYAPRNGSIAEVAAALGKEFERFGHHVMIKETKDLAPVKSSDGVVAGRPIYPGKVIEVKGFTGRLNATLEKRPVTASAVGIGPASLEAAKKEESRKAPDEALLLPEPVSTALFGGVVNLAKVTFFQRKLTALRRPCQGFPGWNAIASRARLLSAEMNPG